MTDLKVESCSIDKSSAAYRPTMMNETATDASTSIPSHFACRLLIRETGLSVLVMAFILSFSGETLANTDDSSRQWNVLLITVDCLRPDHMSVYGYERDTTPYLKRFAEEALVFENAFATSAWTSPGIVSMLTGYYTPVHAQNGRFSFYDKDMTSALRAFVEQGYETEGRAIEGPTYTNLGFQRRLKKHGGLEHLIEKKITSAKPFFAWIHTKEPHLPYNASVKSRTRFAGSFEMSEGIEAIMQHYAIFRPHDVQVKFKHAGKVNFTKQDVPVARALYDAEVADVDERLGRAIERMRETGLLERTILIISADHGEELFEHGWVGHASTSYDGKLYDELIRIPLIIRVPDQSLTGRYQALVQGVDLMPTLFDMLGMDSAKLDPALQGHSLMPLINGKRSSIREYVFMETTRKGWTTPRTQMQHRVSAVRSMDRKLIRHIEQGQTSFEAYDLKTDPQESKNIYSREAGQFRDLEQLLDDWYENNRNVAAALVMSAATTQLAGMAEALQSGNLISATDHWRNIAVMHDTWGLEVTPFYQHEPYRSEWHKLRLSATNQLTQAMRCDAESGSWHKATAEESSVDSQLWVCD